MKCKKCKHWEYVNDKSGECYAGKCHYNPPWHNGFPETLAKDWCRECDERDNKQDFNFGHAK